MANLIDIQIRSAKPKEKDDKLTDGSGLYLLMKTDGTKLWRYNFRYHGKAKTMAFGRYPEVSAKLARERHTAARQQLANDVDPMAPRKADKLVARVDLEATFEVVAREMWAKKQKNGNAQGYVEEVLEKLEKDVFPWIGTRPLRHIDDAEIYAILNRVETRAAETARR